MDLAHLLAWSLAHHLSAELARRGEPCCAIGPVHSMPLRHCWIEAANDQAGGPVLADYFGSPPGAPPPAAPLRRLDGVRTSSVPQAGRLPHAVVSAGVHHGAQLGLGLRPGALSLPAD